MTESDQIIESLSYGEENAIKSDVLQVRTELEARHIRLIVQSLRKLGFPILGGISGYWLPSKDEAIAYRECVRFKKMMRTRAITSFETARAVEKYSRTLTPQIMVDQIDDFNTENEDDEGEFRNGKNTGSTGQRRAQGVLQKLARQKQRQV